MISLRKIFLPDAFNGYYIFPSKIVGFTISKQFVRATVIKAAGKHRTIERCLEETIASDPVTPFVDRAGVAIRTLLDQIGSYDSLYTALSGQSLIFKELSLPFTSLEKIKMIIPFEVESLLPFALHDALIDGIIVHTDTATQKSDILVVAARREIIDEHLSCFQAAGVQPEKITVDVLELYGFYHLIPEYAQLPGVVTVIDLGLSFTRILIMINGVIKGIRILPKGMVNVAQTVHNDMSFDEIATQEWLTNVSIATEPSLSQALTNFFADIQFTLQATLYKFPELSLNKVLLTGSGAEIAGINDAVSDLMNAPCEILYAHKVIQNGTIAAKNHIGIPQAYTISLATALSSPSTAEFNLKPSEPTATEQRLMNVQLIVIFGLMIGLIISLGTHTFLSIRSFKRATYSYEQEAIKKLKDIFTITKVGSLEQANNIARAQLTQEENIWSLLSTHNRFSFLTYLQEISSRIDREALGLDIKRLVVRRNEAGEDILVIEGSVKNYDALRAFEEALIESKLFKEVPKLQEPKFGTITLVLEKEKE